MIVTIAGASGFIGTSLLRGLKDQFEVRGLSRSLEGMHQGVEWKNVDLFSYSQVKSALKNTDVAIYLVHSMLPSSKLFQGRFEDTDLLLADNFAEACRENGVKQIIYLGGLLPETYMSKHLESRREVEEVFLASGTPTTILRAGMVVGDGGTSFGILKNLVLNLPLMILPSWTASDTQVIAIDDLVRVFQKVVNNKDFYQQILNVVNGEKISYMDLIKQTAEHFGRKIPMIPVPVNYTSFSKLWVTFFGRSDYEMVSPLIDSLNCHLPSPDVPTQIADCIQQRTYRSMLKEIPIGIQTKRKTKKAWKENTVRSIQRLKNPQHLSGMEISNEYVSWLPQFMYYLISVKLHGDKIIFKIPFLFNPLLVLQHDNKENKSNRVKLHIIGGMLAKQNNRGWLEFRTVVGGKYTLASINDYTPALPWYLYCYTQAPLHSFVMNSFADHLNKRPCQTEFK